MNYTKINAIIKKVASGFEISKDTKEAFLEDTDTPDMIFEALQKYKNQLPNFNKAKDQQAYIDAVIDEIDATKYE